MATKPFRSVPFIVATVMSLAACDGSRTGLGDVASSPSSRYVIRGTDRSSQTPPASALQGSVEVNTPPALSPGSGGQFRQGRGVQNLGPLLETQHLRRAEQADRDARDAELAAARARARRAEAIRRDRQLERTARQNLSAIQREIIGHQEDRAERAIRDAEAAQRDADRLATQARRRARLERLLAEDAARAQDTPPWKRLIRFRRETEPLPDFRRRVVNAIRRASTEGGSVQDYL